jgi:peptidoglycan/xylan/chitin deacetylase (PgdA/CDA1 family)
VKVVQSSHPTQRGGITLRFAPPVILGYHGIADVEPRHDPVRLFVSPARLRAQIRRLQRRGYRFLTMAAFAEELAAGGPPARTCALTFDDGTEDHLTELRPLLEELGVPGTVYVCPGLYGEAYPWCDPSAGIRMMTAEEVAELARSPLVEIGSHTLRHTVLETASAEEAYREMATCKQVLEDSLGVEIPSFCYPRCAYSPACPDAARRSGYSNAVTCGRRGGWQPFELKRESFHTPDGAVTFALKSRGLYYGLRDAPPARLSRWATRPIRHRSERS